MRIFAAAALAALAVLAGTARGDTFAVVPSASAPALPDLSGLPSSGFPNLPGSVPVPSDLMTPPAVPEQRTYAELQALWQRAGAAYGVPWQVLGAINKVESNFGRNMGPSSAGAIGWMQFMPSTWLRWGIDANGDGIADPWNAEDAVFSAARYLAAAGGSADVPRAVYAYNHAGWYVQEVLGLAQLYQQGGAVAFSLDELQARLERAREQVVAANESLDAQLTLVRSLARAERPWRSVAARAQLLSDRLEAQRHEGMIELRRQAAEAIAAQRRTRLHAAQARLARVRAQARPAAFANAAGTLLSAPSFSNGYVFPVGGGPGIVSVAHTHHDYPAADIAAPEGTPVYALADSVVQRAWTYPDPRCGIGLTLQADDGQIWTYCHLAYEDPAVQPGARLAAGTEVGLVGSTGDATGPHLHLQLQPPDQWPQAEQWFQSFAGTAFSWQDAPTPLDGAPAAAEPVVQFTQAAPQVQSRRLAVAPAPAPAPASAPAAAQSAPVFRVVARQASPAVLFTR